MIRLEKRKAVTETDKFLMSLGWEPVGFSLWSHPMAPKNTSFNLDEAVKLSCQYRPSREQLAFRAIESLVRKPWMILMPSCRAHLKFLTQDPTDE